MARVTVFGPSPLLAVSIDAAPGLRGEQIGVAAAGQGVWVAGAASAMGADVVLCGLSGGTVGRALQPLIDTSIDARLVPGVGQAGCYVVDRRSGHDEVLATAWSAPPRPDEIDTLLSLAAEAARDSDVFVVCNPMPGDLLPLDVYTSVTRRARAAGSRVLVDLSSPRLDSALRGQPELVKINDWELAEYVVGPVEDPEDRDAAIDRLASAGAGSVVVTRGDRSVHAVDPQGERLELVPPHLGAGDPAGCGDAMTGALAAALAGGHPWLDAVRLGVAVGAAHFVRGTVHEGLRPWLDELVQQVLVTRITG